VLSGRSLCDGLITRPEKSCRLCCVIVCDLETSRMRRLKPASGLSKPIKEEELLFPWFENVELVIVIAIFKHRFCVKAVCLFCL
jgi:hypothetical protein